MTDDERRFKRTGRQLVWLTILWVPIMFMVEYSTFKFTHSYWPFTIAAATYLLVLMVISIERLMTHHRIKQTKPTRLSRNGN